MPTYKEVKSIVDTAHSSNKRVSVHISHKRNLKWAIDAGADEIAHMVVEPLGTAEIDEMVTKGIYWVPTLELWKGVSESYSLDWLDVAVENLAAFYKAGGKIALGTDFEGYTCKFDDGFPITEVKLMNKAGMTNMDIITAGTKNSADTCGVGKERGTVEAGKRADILVVSGNPLSDINTLANTKMVIHNGQVVVSR
jgi:imidazolonepropionase-like amidohydrolase